MHSLELLMQRGRVGQLQSPFSSQLFEKPSVKKLQHFCFIIVYVCFNVFFKCTIKFRKSSYTGVEFYQTGKLFTMKKGN